MDADLERRGGRRRGPALRQGPPGRRHFWLGKGTLKTALAGTVRGHRGAAGAGPRRLALRGAVRRPAGRPRGVRRRPATSTESWPGTRSARKRGPASSTSRRAAAPRTSSSARRSACRSSRRSTKSGIFLDGFGGAQPSRRPRRRGADRRAPRSDTDRFYRLEPYHHRYPHCWRCGTPLVFRLVDEWYISMGPVYDKPRDELTAEQVDAEPALPDHGGRRPRSAGSRTSATSASSTGSATCTTG